MNRLEVLMVQRRAARLLSSVLALLALTTPLRAELTNGRALAAVYDSILAGRFDAAERELRAACPPAPAEACQAMAVRCAVKSCLASVVIARSMANLVYIAELTPRLIRPIP